MKLNSINLTKKCTDCIEAMARVVPDYRKSLSVCKSKELSNGVLKVSVELPDYRRVTVTTIHPVRPNLTLFAGI